MRIILVLILAFLLFEPPPIGCSYFTRHVPENAYPETVGRFQREYVLHGGEREIATKYNDPNRPKLHSIGLELSLDNLLDSSGARCSDQYYASGSLGIVMLKKEELKNGVGDAVGEIRICRGREQEADNYYVEMSHNEVTLFLRTNNLFGETDRTQPVPLNDLLEFVENIPFNAQLDLKR